jgi:hypothetical protein
MMLERIQAKVARMTVVRDTLRDYRRIASSYGRYSDRRKAVSTSGHSALSIGKDKGFSIGTIDDIPGLPMIAVDLRAWAQKRIDALDLKRVLALSETGLVKPFYFNILSRDDVKAIPQLIEFAISDPMLDILAPYYGILPELSHMAVFASGLFGAFDGKRRGTQQMHWDNHDRGHVKMFCFLDPVTDDDGPLTVLPADKSYWLRKKTGRLLGTFPIKDEREFYRYFTDADLIKITGPAGTVAFVDTTKCLHYGSRTQQGGRRLSFVIHYTMFADYGSIRTGDFQDLNLATSPELRPPNLVGRQALAYRIVQPIKN